MICNSWNCLWHRIRRFLLVMTGSILTIRKIVMWGKLLTSFANVFAEQFFCFVLFTHTLFLFLSFVVVFDIFFGSFYIFINFRIYLQFSYSFGCWLNETFYPKLLSRTLSWQWQQAKSPPSSCCFDLRLVFFLSGWCHFCYLLDVVFKKCLSYQRNGNRNFHKTLGLYSSEWVNEWTS